MARNRRAAVAVRNRVKSRPSCLGPALSKTHNTVSHGTRPASVVPHLTGPVVRQATDHPEELMVD